MFGVGRVGERLEEVGVAPGAATVLGGAGPPPSDTARVGDAVGHGFDGLDGDVMGPTVTEVVVPLHLHLDAGQDVAERGSSFVLHWSPAEVVVGGKLVDDPGGVEGVEMATEPPHRRFQFGRQLVERRGRADLDPPPHRWSDPSKGHLQTMHSWSVGSHGPSLP